MVARSLKTNPKATCKGAHNLFARWYIVMYIDVLNFVEYPTKQDALNAARGEPINNYPTRGGCNCSSSKREFRREDDHRLIPAKRQRLHDAGIGLAALAELLERELVVMVLIHLVEDLVNAFLRRVLVLWLWSLALEVYAYLYLSCIYSQKVVIVMGQVKALSAKSEKI